MKIKQQSEPEVDKLLSMVDFSIFRFQKTVRELIEISKTQRNIENEILNFNVNDLVEDVLSSVANIILESNADIQCDINPYLEINYSIINFKSIVTNLVIMQ